MGARIEDYALVGDCETAALISRDGSVDWLCWPRFDSAACFAALLGDDTNGRWRLAPVKASKATRRYRPDTLILETEFVGADGAVRVTDFMPPRGDISDLVRIVQGLRGTVRMRAELTIRFDYGASVPWVTHPEEGMLQAIAGPDMVILRSPVRLKGENMASIAEFDVHAGETVPFVLTYGASHLPPPQPLDPIEALQHTESFWTEWIAKSRNGGGPYAEAVRRSSITLKALTYRPTGGIVAAPTTSLPEHIGGVRNWDYRYCWLRDATLSLLALMNEGCFEEARAWRDWLMRAAAGSPAQVRIMYGLAGERRLAEWEVPWLSGYENSRPVRIGNGAAGQLQLDVFGEVMDALFQARCGGVQSSTEGWALQRALLDHLEGIWREPDEGIWEIRGERRHFTYSKVMAWVAFDRAIRSAKMFGLDGPLEKWRAIRAEIHADVCAKGFDPNLNAFTQSYGSACIDASALLFPTVGFLPPKDKRVSGTIAAVERSLLRDGLVLRYRTAETLDGLPAGEGAFLACSFWLADAYVLCGRREDGQRLFEHLLSLRNDLGLLAEEYDPAAKRQLGNFPQAFSHIALINTAHNLSSADKPAEQRSGEEKLERAAG